MRKTTGVVLLVLLLFTSLMLVAGCGEKEATTEPSKTIEETTPASTIETTTPVQTQPTAQPVQTQPVVAPAPAPAPAPPTEAMVVVTRTGEKYHTASCRYVTGKTDTRTLPLSQAKSEGYTPCSVCGPPQ